MKKRMISLAISIIMLITSFIGAMPVSAAKTTTTTTKATIVTKYVVPYENNYAAVRETPSTTEKHPLQVMSYERGEYCIYIKSIPVEKDKDKDNEVETWYVVETVWGQTGYVASWAAHVVEEKPTKPSTSTTVSTAVSTTASTTVKPTTTTTTKKQTTTTTAKVTTTTKVNSSLYYLTSTDVTNIRAGKSTKFAKVGVVKKNEVAVADKLENGWYHIIQKDSKKMDGWCMACYMKKVPAPTTVSTTVKPTSAKTTTTVKPTTTKSTTKKTATTTIKATTTTKKQTTTTTAKVTTTTKVNSSLYYLTSTDVTNIRAGKSTKFAKVGVVKKNEVAVADKLENGWYHIIQKDSKKMDGWCKASLMKEVPAPTTTVTTTTSTVAKPTTTTASKSSTTTTKKPIFLYFDLGKGGKTQLEDVKVVNRTKIQVGFSYDPNTNTLYIDSVG